jgi:predicted nucleic acid-binding protein
VTSYADTGFLFSLYLPETTTPAASAAFRSVKPPVPVTPLGFLELRVALHLSVFRGQIDETQRRAVWQLIEQDFQEGLFVLTPVASSALYEQAAKLAEKYSTTVGTRTLDLLHVAAALTLGAKQMFTFDARQRRTAHGEGLKVLPAMTAR